MGKVTLVFDGHGVEKSIENILKQSGHKSLAFLRMGDIEIHIKRIEIEEIVGESETIKTIEIEKMAENIRLKALKNRHETHIKKLQNKLHSLKIKNIKASKLISKLIHERDKIKAEPKPTEVEEINNFISFKLEEFILSHPHIKPNTIFVDNKSYKLLEKDVVKTFFLNHIPKRLFQQDMEILSHTDLKPKEVKIAYISD